ncbi:hypothetical protein LX32DRAFT_73806 [Colletotrichum zoysiae]|uniref:Uncharacterized protein n=1 Tax=Colletotrichum zoysiae TaxID=1216348 RepID=A0AAD9HTC8_9PEZI|nr:hypothetical protein LX32DRAFT_73806 [Colletotrichum zoysiae]
MLTSEPELEPLVTTTNNNYVIGGVASLGPFSRRRDIHSAHCWRMRWSPEGHLIISTLSSSHAWPG